LSDFDFGSENFDCVHCVDSYSVLNEHAYHWLFKFYLKFILPQKENMNPIKSLDEFFCIDIWGIIFEYMIQTKHPWKLYFEPEPSLEFDLFLDACQEGSVEIVDFLMRKLDIDVARIGDEAFLTASTNRNLDVMKFLIKHGAKISKIKIFAYRYACTKGHIDVMKFLTQNDISLLQKRFAIRMAYDCNQQKVIRYLNKQGIPLDAIFEDSDDETDIDS